MLKLDAFRLRIIVLALISTTLAATFAIFLYQDRRTQTLKLAAGSSTGESFIVASALKKVIERRQPRIKIEILETGGTAENLEMLENRRADLAAAQADVPALGSARVVAILYEDHFQVLAKDTSGVRSFADLKGKRIALPQRGGQYRSFIAVAEHFGLAASDFQFVGADDRSADQIFLDGQADAVFRVRALGNPSMMKLARTAQAHFVPIPQGAAMRIKYPSFQPSVIPEGAYLGNPSIPAEDLATIAVQRTLLAHRDADAAAIQLLTATLVEHRPEIAHEIPDALSDVRPLLAGVKHPETQTGLGAPVHDGAQAYYDKDKPSFIQEHADFVALIVTVIVLLGSWVWEAKGWIERRQKNQADLFSHDVIRLMNEAQTTRDVAKLDSIRHELLPILTDAVGALDEDRISEESFQSFRVVWQISLDLIRERRHALAETSSVA
jgi:TRAP transporter TAXI family solute receptor